jgi:addiction module RelB/DinJ family antitoxin
MSNLKTSTISVRIKPSVKTNATKVLSKLGISHSDAINLFYTQIAIKNGIPFELTLEDNDVEENYTKVKSESNLKNILNI